MNPLNHSSLIVSTSPEVMLGLLIFGGVVALLLLLLLLAIEDGSYSEFGNALFRSRATRRKFMVKKYWKELGYVKG